MEDVKSETQTKDGGEGERPVDVASGTWFDPEVLRFYLEGHEPAELVEYCRGRGLPEDGEKAELVERLLAWNDERPRPADQEEANGDGDPRRTTREELDAMTCEDLRKTLKDLGEPIGGNKADLVERLLKRNGGGDPPAADTPDLEGDRIRRLELEELNGKLARKRCLRCATTGAWRVLETERTGGRVRYVACKGCGWRSQVAVNSGRERKEEDHDAANQE